MLKKELLEILACPHTGESLVYDENRNTLTSSKYEYPVKNDIPVMLPQLQVSEAAPNEPEANEQLGYGKLSELEVNEQQLEFHRKSRYDKANKIATIIDRYADSEITGPVISVGCGKGYMEEVWVKHWPVLFAGFDFDIDSLMESKADFCKINASGDYLPFRDNSIQLAILQMILEHITDYKRCAQELDRIVKPGGYIYIHVPAPWSIFPGTRPFSHSKWSAPRYYMEYLGRRFKKDFLINRALYHTGFTFREIQKLFPNFVAQNVYTSRLALEAPRIPGFLIKAYEYLPYFLRNVLDMGVYVFLTKR